MLLILSLLTDWKLGWPWLPYVVLILAPNLFRLAYLGGPRLGADTHLGRIRRNR